MKQNRDLSKFNATKHGVLSQYSVLPWENESEYQQLHDLLIEEHKPNGPTEFHFVEELAGIIWRKKRLRKAENATIVQDIHHESTRRGQQHIEAVLNSKQCRGNYLPSTEVLAEHPKDIPVAIEVTKEDIADNDKIMDILTSNDKDSYTKALDLLDVGTLNKWTQALSSNDGYEETAKSLSGFIKYKIQPELFTQLVHFRNFNAIRHQVEGSSIDPDKLGKLAKYEAHLDRKMQKILAMLLKLQELRGTKS